MLNLQNNKIVIISDKFKGPLEHLLDLIEKRKMSINELALSKITGEFIELTARLRLPKKIYADFIELASTLVFIKSKSLLPVKPEDIDENSEELQRRLKALKFLRAKSKKMLCYKDSLFLLSKGAKNFLAPEFEEPKITLVDIEEAKNIILQFVPQLSEAFKIKKTKTRTLSDVLNDLKMRLRKYAKLSFSSLSVKSKEDKLLNFLAVLELKRKGELDIIVKKDDFLIVQSSENLNVPHYG